MQTLTAVVVSTMLTCPIQYMASSDRFPELTEHDGAVYKDLGEFKITYYNGDGSALEGGSKNCLGEDLQEGMIAVDPDVIELGSKVLIEGQEYTACDVGGAIKNKKIDIYRDVSLDELNQLGVGYKNVKVRIDN